MAVRHQKSTRKSKSQTARKEPQELTLSNPAHPAKLQKAKPIESTPASLPLRPESPVSPYRMQRFYWGLAICVIALIARGILLQQELNPAIAYFTALLGTCIGLAVALKPIPGTINIFEGPSYVPALDTLRFFAFLLVLIHHLPEKSNDGTVNIMHHLGWSGVELFFVISSYLFFFLLFREHEKTGKISFFRFYLRRILRIWPLYYFYIFFLFNFSWQAIPERVHYSMMFLDNLMVHREGLYNPAAPMMQHLWTISFEEQVYLVTPLIAWVAIKLCKRGHEWLVFFLLLLFPILGAFARYWGYLHLIPNFEFKQYSVWVLPAFRSEPIFAGFLVAFFMETPLIKRVNYLVFLYLLVGVCNYLFIGPCTTSIEPRDSLSIFAIIALGYGSIVALMVQQNGWLSKIFGIQPFAFLGKISFGLYVWHFIAIRWAADFVTKNNIDFGYLGLGGAWWAQALVAFGMTLGCSVASYYILETPFLYLKKFVTTIHNRSI